MQITVAEEEGVGTRAGYYEQAGALRDMVQNHLLQLLALVAMEPPRSLDADVVRDEKLEVLQSLRPIDGDDVDAHVVRGQYSGGLRAAARRCPATASEHRRQPARRAPRRSSRCRLFIDNWRWAGVPFFLRTGKRLPKRASEIAIQFKDVPPILFNANPARPLEPNVLSIRIQPDEGFSLGIASKLPGPRVRIYPVKMDFHYGSTFGGTSPEAYERLLLDVMAGDATLFMRRDAVEAAWRFVMPILDRWASRPTARCRRMRPASGDRRKPIGSFNPQDAHGGLCKRARADVPAVDARRSRRRPREPLDRGWARHARRPCADGQSRRVLRAPPRRARRLRGPADLRAARRGRAAASVARRDPAPFARRCRGRWHAGRGGGDRPHVRRRVGAIRRRADRRALGVRRGVAAVDRPPPDARRRADLDLVDRGSSRERRRSAR